MGFDHGKQVARTSNVMLRKTKTPKPAETAQLQDEERRTARPKRENFKLPEKCAADLERISQESQITKTEVVRQGIALIRIAWDESKAGNRLAVVNSKDQVLKELIVP